MNIFEKLDQFLTNLKIDYEISQKDGKIEIKVIDSTNRKSEFENFVKRIDDEIFMEAYEDMDKDLIRKYDSNPDETIDEYLQILIEKLGNHISELEDLCDEARVLLENS